MMKFGSTSDTFCVTIPQYGVLITGGRVSVYLKINIRKQITIAIDTNSDSVCSTDAPCGVDCLQAYTASWREEGMPILKALKEACEADTNSPSFECECLLKTRKVCTVSGSGHDEISCDQLQNCSIGGCSDFAAVNKDKSLSPGDFPRYSVSCLAILPLGDMSEDCSIEEEAESGGILRYRKTRHVLTTYGQSC